MRVYDLHVHSAFSVGESTLEQLAQTAKTLGYSGICFTAYWKDKRQLEIIESETSRVKESVGIEIFTGFEARSVGELKRLAELRRLFDVLLVHGGDLEINRAAVETPEVDILAHPEYERPDSGLNQTLVKLAAKNNVAIEINFSHILTSNRYVRARTLKNMKQNILLAKKYKAPIILCSGSVSHYGLRDPYSMVSMAVQLGIELGKAKGCLSKVPEDIVRRSKERRDGNWVMPGVKVIE